MPATPDDDGFREIQLSGKQLVFLFMAATVVSVVIFLSGVLVGRGVKAERAAALQADVLTASPVPDAPSAPPPTPGEADPRNAAPPSDVVGELEGARSPGDTVPRELEEAPVAVDRSKARKGAPAESNDPRPDPTPAAASKGAGASKPPAPAATAKATAPAASPTSSPASEAATRSGYAVQVAAVDGRGEADAMVKRLSDKGYTAYVEQPRGTRVFRVRVGTFRTRRDAQAVADKLQKEEKFKPWVTR